MSKRRKKGKSIVPVKYQLPMAAVLALLFVALLGSTVKRVKAAKQRPAPTTGAVAAAPPPAEPTETGDTTARMQFLIDSLSNVKNEETATFIVAADKLNDPFAEFKPDVTKIEKKAPVPARVTAEVRRREEEERRKMREIRDSAAERLDLQGTFLNGKTRLAIINGKLFAENDLIERFRIVNVGDGQVKLRDDYGDVFLKAKGDEKI